MTNKRTSGDSRDGDSWGELLSNFGIEEQSPAEDAAPQAEPNMPQPDLEADLTEPEREVADELPKTKEKKSILSRFPKINNFFGVPPQVSLDSVIEGAKSPSLGGKTFTDNKLEKMPFSQERKEQPEKKSAERPDAWSAVASQIDVLASGAGASEAGNGTKTKPEERIAKRHVSSMFDDPIPESEEERALKSLMEEQTNSERKRRVAFLEEESDIRQRGRSGEVGRGRPQQQVEDAGGRGRGSRYKPPVEVDDLSETVFEPVDDVPRSRERGRRGSRYDGPRDRDRDRDRGRVRDDVPQEEWSEIDAALQASPDEPTRRGRGSGGGGGERHQRQERDRYDKRQKPERAERLVGEREISEPEDSGIIAFHGNIPSWDEAVDDIIAGNIARHKSSSGGSAASGGSSGRRGGGKGRR